MLLYGIALTANELIYLILWLDLCSLIKVIVYKVSKKANIKNRYNPVPHLTQDTTWQSDKNTRKLHIQASQEVSLFLAGDHRAAVNRQESMTNTKHNKNYPQNKHRLRKVSKIFFFTGGLKLYSYTHSL